MFGRNQPPQTDTIRTVLGIRGEPGTPEVAARGKVWTSILRLVDRPDEENEYVSVEDAPRTRFSKHPWSLQGGAAPKVQEAIEETTDALLGNYATSVGFLAITGEDDLFTEWQRGALTRRLKIPTTHVVDFVTGDLVRDWVVSSTPEALYPYDQRLGFDLPTSAGQLCWPFRRLLETGLMFKKTRAERGLGWASYAFLSDERVAAEFLITFAFVATHNHFVLDRGGKVFNRSAPVIKLPAGATEDDHLKLLGLLNSSAACFWMKQIFHNKGDSTDSAGARVTGVDAWVDSYEHDGTKLKQFPIPAGAPLERARELDRLAQQLAGSLPSAVVEDATPTRDRLARAHERVEAIRARMVAIQEELDWECYHLYGLTDEELTAPADQVPELKKGERAFEIVLARKMAAGEAESTWFSRHGSTPITELPAHWPEAYRRVVERRIALIESDRSIGLLERPEYKRRWNWASWEDLQKEALRGWLLDRLEARELWADGELMTTARLADRVRRSEEFVEAARLYAGRVDVDLTELVTELVKDEAVPFAAGYRFKASGLRRRREWEEVWELQRQEDAIDARTALPADDPQHLTEAAAERLKKEQGLDRIPVPPKYRQADYADVTTYRLRGKLDVPQERFIRYPGTRKGADTTPAIGWAGWDHLEQARALASHYAARKDQGAEAAELVSLLAGLQELVPWLLQWHNEMDQEFGYRMGDFFASFVETEAQSLGRTVEDLKTWTPK